jgi:hypothetical protein
MMSHGGSVELILFLLHKFAPRPGNVLVLVRIDSLYHATIPDLPCQSLGGNCPSRLVTVEGNDATTTRRQNHLLDVNCQRIIHIISSSTLRWTRCRQQLPRLLLQSWTKKEQNLHPKWLEPYRLYGRQIHRCIQPPSTLPCKVAAKSSFAHLQLCNSPKHRPKRHSYGCRRLYHRHCPSCCTGG